MCQRRQIFLGNAFLSGATMVLCLRRLQNDSRIPISPEHPSAGHHRTPQIYTLEATGLLVIAALILILTLVRYWHHIAWGVR